MYGLRRLRLVSLGRLRSPISDSRGKCTRQSIWRKGDFCPVLVAGPRLDSMMALFEKVSSLEVEVSRLRAKDIESNTIIQTLQDIVHRQEQYSRRDSLEISEVPVTPNESTDGIDLKIAQKMGVQLSSSDISVSHRLKANDGKTPAIIVKFISRKKRNEIFHAKKKIITREELVTCSGSGRIYIGDSLSPFYKQLLWKALGYCWLWNGVGM